MLDPASANEDKVHKKSESHTQKDERNINGVRIGARDTHAFQDGVGGVLDEKEKIGN